VSLAAACGGWVAAGIVTAVLLLVQRALDARMEAVARACHELRGPITAARLGLELGSRGGALSPAQLAAINSELRRATLALDDLAHAPEGRQAPREIEAVDLGVLLRDCVRAWRPVATEAGVELRLECRESLAGVRGDPLRLAQAAGNLIANAIEHGGTQVEVQARRDAAGVRIEVVDDGPGLPAPVEELARRARHGRGRRGRGLAIVTAVAAVHGGRLSAAPSDRGARMVLELPTASG
jgi:signal transduction histidine kinase